MRKILVLILSIIVSGILIINIYALAFSKAFFNNKSNAKKYERINRTYTGYIFAHDGKIIEKVPIRLNGKLYSSVGVYMAYFDGTIEIDGRSEHVISDKEKFTGVTDMDTKSYYNAEDFTSFQEFKRSQKEKTKLVVRLKTIVSISKDFKSLYGCSDNLIKKYKQPMWFKTSMNLHIPYFH